MNLAVGFYCKGLSSGPKTLSPDQLVSRDVHGVWREGRIARLQPPGWVISVTDYIVAR